MISHEMLVIVGPAVTAGLMIALTHAPLGIEVLKRGIIFIDLAIAQIAGLGLLVGEIYWSDAPAWMMQGGALLLALLAGWFFRMIEKSNAEYQEAIIGVSFVLAASLALLLLADNPHGGEEMEYLLSGQILFVTWEDVAKHGGIYLVILALWFGKISLREGVSFYVLFVLAITSSVQLVGVYVVFASLILPALAAANRYRPHLWAWGCGVTSVVLGIICAWIVDMPAGPLLVVTYTMVTLCLVLVASWIKRMAKKQG